MRRWLVILFMLLLAGRGQQALCADSSPPSKPPVWAVYYLWYQTATGPHGKWQTWTRDKTQAPNPKPSSRAQPLIGYYDSDNPEVVRWHMRLAKRAGINAFLVDWWGREHFSGPILENVILPIAASEQFKVALCNELGQFHKDLNYVAWDLADEFLRIKDSPVYLRVDGKPVVYLYQVPFAPRLTPKTFAELKRGVESRVGPVYWMVDKISNEDDRGMRFPTEWLQVPEIPAIGFYGTFSVKRMWKYSELAPQYNYLARQAHTAGKKVFLPVHPGLDNSGIQSPSFIIPRDDGATLRGYLNAAADAGADVILLTSFNEWPETTIVEPSSSWADPYCYLKVLAEWKGLTFTQPPLPQRIRLASGTL